VGHAFQHLFQRSLAGDLLEQGAVLGGQQLGVARNKEDLPPFCLASLRSAAEAPRGARAHGGRG
jgi:hypothetical protein